MGNKPFFKNRGAKSSPILVGILVIGVLGFLGIYAYSTGVLGNTPAPAASFNPTPSAPAPGPSTASGLSDGDQTTVTLTHIDAVTNGVLTEATHVKTTHVHKTSFGTFTAGTTGSAQTYTLGPYDEGKIWLSFEAQASGQQYIFDEGVTRSINAYVEDCVWADIDTDIVKEFVCPVQTTGLFKQSTFGNQKPDRALTIAWDNEHEPTVTGIAGTAPADQTGFGTSVATATVLWGLDGTNGDTAHIRQIELRFNSTDTTEFIDSQSTLTINNEIVPLNTIAYTQDGTYTYWRINYGTELDGAKVLKIPASGNDKLPVTLQFRMDIDTSENRLLRLQVTYVDEVMNSIVGSDELKITA